MLTSESKHEQCHMRDHCQQYHQCPMVTVQNMLTGKRKILILWYLSYQTLRFNEIKKKMPDVTQKMLTQQLRSLEADGLINRKVYPVVPPKVEYALTPLGQKILPILEAMHNFGSEYLSIQLEADA